MQRHYLHSTPRPLGRGVEVDMEVEVVEMEEEEHGWKARSEGSDHR